MTAPTQDLDTAAATARGNQPDAVCGRSGGARAAALLSTLTRRQRDILRLRVIEGLSVEESAAVLRTTPGAVRVDQHRALSRLRAALADPVRMDAVTGPGDSRSRRGAVARLPRASAVPP
ncbi:sigma factor-like helix-turn-helix DNA-binding protein [Rhodococcus ruber]|uniref:RNA polymerase sigma factor 70 region 4 type 2 domain-containing protein n=2 Tax=Nocardiaceae TaxID=85025 RepID=A0A098BEA6_9NOCA|nr:MULTISPECIES: sigma factor-like helix-turn-helix DNA-binding protein [Rhodococcus]MCZ4501505.1 sigma factor-like helix-turn-helix DNA-binding protein [Rhodococcus ruber]MCZ4528690.1 sigma factor-like helix-turn-helix DNA-binding protein [Rhodococcus ruber]MCZ4619668.1 sigma factor-like helix-turn-helix DNA-binding protein [Rhodococcus ruber]MDI9968788.1 sigma factor-like helix-turn-helix DNA-binding protein [Rhodococcus ruber]MDI9980453.1 sigma factor-like helix-turn-helix DNA-binding prote